jgi:hypothetical protein
MRERGGREGWRDRRERRTEYVRLRNRRRGKRGEKERRKTKVFLFIFQHRREREEGLPDRRLCRRTSSSPTASS